MFPCWWWLSASDVFEPKPSAGSARDRHFRRARARFLRRLVKAQARLFEMVRNSLGSGPIFFKAPPIANIKVMLMTIVTHLSRGQMSRLVWCIRMQTRWPHPPPINTTYSTVQHVEWVGFRIGSSQIPSYNNSISKRIISTSFYLENADLNFIPAKLGKNTDELAILF